MSMPNFILGKLKKNVQHLVILKKSNSEMGFVTSYSQQ